MPEIKREMVTVQRLHDIQDIPGADRIQKAKVLEYQVVIEKGKYKENDLVLFFEEDAWLPKKEVFQFMESSNYRVKIKKFKGCISEGMVMPLKTAIPFLQEKSIPEMAYSKIMIEGKNMSSLLGVVKWEDVDYKLRGNGKGRFPSHTPKTDQARLQKNEFALEQLKGKPYWISKKMDGTSCTFYYLDGKFGVCTRTQELKETMDNVYWYLARKYDIDEILKKYDGYAIQGEGCGPKVQKNPLGLRDLELFVFDVYNIKEKRYLNFGELKSFCKDNNLQMVPIVEEGNNFQYTMDDIRRISEEQKYGDIPGEGIVIKSQIEEYCHIEGGRLSGKFINTLYHTEQKRIKKENKND